MLNTLAPLMVLTCLLFFVSAAVALPLDGRSVLHLERRPELQLTKRDAPLYPWTAIPKLNTAKYTTGVAAMQLVVVDTETVVILDKSEHNPATVKTSGVEHPAWIVTLNIKSGKRTALPAISNSFCGGGTILGNGTLVSIGGTPSAGADYHDTNGLTSIRIFENCGNTGCTLKENADRIRLGSARWYPSSSRLPDGSMLIMGGMISTGFNNAEATDNPTIEYFPSKALNNGLPIHSKFLHDALNSNLFPVVHLLPSGELFVAANNLAMIYNWEKNRETRLPNLPKGLRVTYPYTAASALLPLTIANKWTPTVLFCGGSYDDDTVPASKKSSQLSTANECVTMTLDDAGIKKGWITDSQTLTTGRIMTDAVLTPDKKVVLVNGATTGVAGFGDVPDPVGASNADNPAFRGMIYDPLQPAGSHISAGMPTSKIPRMYHSTATLLPTGEIMITGSNPNNDVSTMRYQTEYSVEILSPPYMDADRPTFEGLPDKLPYGKPFTLTISPQKKVSADQITFVLMDLGYHTHGVGMDQKLVELVSHDYNADTNQIRVDAPKNGSVLAPGLVWLFAVVDGIPSKGSRVLLGEGKNPPFDKNAYNNMISRTKPAT